MKKLFLLTSSFPYEKAKEDTFIIPELEVMQDNFNVTIIPLRKGHCTYNIPNSLEIREGFCQISSKKILMMLKAAVNYDFWVLFFKEFFANFSKMFYFECLKELIVVSLFAFNLEKWLSNELRNEKNLINNDTTIIYSYWLSSGAVAIALLKKKRKFRFWAIARGHGFDLYEYRHKKNYIPFRKFTLENIDKLILISEDGLEYLKRKYPSYSEKYEYFPMGVCKSSSRCAFSKDDKFRIISCSNLIPLKRVNLIAESIFCLGKSSKKSEWEWTHIGDGPQRKEIEDYIKRKCPLNVKVNLIGHIDYKKVNEFYESQQIDVFIQLSETEGRPLSIMEAMNYGLPIIATDVGGVGELVHNYKNGFLLPPNVTPKEVAEKILFLKNKPDVKRQMGEKSFEIFLQKADAKVNYQAFADFLSAL